MPAEHREQALDLLRSKHRMPQDVAHLTCEQLFCLAVGNAPDDWQSKLLRSEQRQLILNCSRQSGKSQLSAIIGLHTALFTPNALVLLAAPSLRQSSELHRKVMQAYSGVSGVPRLTATSALKAEFDNGSRVQVVPSTEETVRGFSAVNLLICDEASRISDELYFSLRPVLAVSKGRIVLLSTPSGQRGFFYKEWIEGTEWERARITAAECPRIDPQWLEEERNRIGDYWFQQEYGCEFQDTTTAIFRSADYDNCITSEVKPLWAKVAQATSVSVIQPAVL